MLTRELLRCKFQDGLVSPRLLKRTPANLALAEGLIAFWTGARGQRRVEIEEQLALLLHQARAIVVARGLSRLIEEQCRFAEPAALCALRETAFAISMRHLATPASSGEAHAAAVASELALAPAELTSRLYADLPDADVLEESPVLSAPELIDAYNLALCQGLLLGASQLSVRIADADTAVVRRVLKALRLRRLVAAVSRRSGQELRLEVSGPASVLEQSSRYGLQLALFLPEIACCTAWSCTAEVTMTQRDRSRRRGRLELSDALGLVGRSAFIQFIPEELRRLEAMLADRMPEWRCEEPAVLPLPDGELVVPDLQMRHAETVVAIELFHRWHAAALERRLAQLALGELSGLLIGVDRSLSRSTQGSGLVASAAFTRHGFLFSELPTARAIAERIATRPAIP
jgi:predicted nuclease of restriction endonuclease-like RecB superfamily